MGRTHLRGLEGSTEVTVVAVTEPVEAAAAPLREQGLAMYPTAEDMFADSELDGVLIAVPTPQHIDTTRRAREAVRPGAGRGQGGRRTRERTGTGPANRLLAAIRAAADDPSQRSRRRQVRRCALPGVLTVGRGSATPELPPRQRWHLYRHGCPRNRPN